MGDNITAEPAPLEKETDHMTETILVKTPGGRMRSMSADEYDALRERAVTNAVTVSRQLDNEEETSARSPQ